MSCSALVMFGIGHVAVRWRCIPALMLGHLSRRSRLDLLVVIIRTEEVVKSIVETLFFVFVIMISRALIVAHNSRKVVPQDANTSIAIVTDGIRE